MSGKVISCEMGPAYTITLPSAEAGLNYRIAIRELPASGTRIAAASGDAFFGTCAVYEKDTTSGLTGPAHQAVLYSTAIGAPTTYNRIRLEYDGTVTGGADGDLIELIAVTDAAWLVNCRLGTTGTPITVEVIAGEDNS